MENFLAHSEETRKELLEGIQIESIEDLFKLIPQKAKMTQFNLPEALSEMQTQKVVKSLAKKNNSEMINFLGAGVYNHFTPACISQVAQRFEFITAYTPYQPEISQGTLQIMYEFQSMICNLTGMDVSNASVYDGATACAEAILMAARITKKNKAFVSENLNPEYKEVIKTYMWANNIEIDWFEGQCPRHCEKSSDEAIQKANDYAMLKQVQHDVSVDGEGLNFEQYACVLVQNPDFYGNISEIDFGAKLQDAKCLLAVCVDISSLAILKAPSEYGSRCKPDFARDERDKQGELNVSDVRGCKANSTGAEYGADIVVGDIQPLGLPMSFGGPHGGFMACKEKHMRQLPGRIAGRTLDVDGNQAFTLTIQTREQHIKREKATSNICSNQALMALCATLYLSLLGEKGFKQAAVLSAKNAHELSKKLAQKGIKTINKDFYNEFVIEVEDADKFLANLRENNILGGLKLDNNKILVATTEMNTSEEIELYYSSLKIL